MSTISVNARAACDAVPCDGVMDDIAGLTPLAHRPIRRVDALECAFDGELVADGDVVRVRIPVERIPEALWTFADAEHVAGVRDVLRTPSGHDALLPWCPDSLDAFLGRRTAAEQPLSAGETVTLVGSLLRGIVEVGDAELRGRWWLTDDARPIFAAGEGSGCADAAVQVILRVRDSCDDRLLDRLLGSIATAAADPRAVRRAITEWERELTELAAPRAIERDVFPAERISEVSVHRQRAPREVDDVGESRSALLTLFTTLGSGLDRARTRALERLRSWRARRRTHPSGQPPHVERATRPARPKAVTDASAVAKPRRGRLALVGVTAAAVVLGAGLLWPPDAEDSAAIEQMAPVATGSAAETGAPESEGTEGSAQPSPPRADEAEVTPPAGAGDSVEQAGLRLLAAVSECAQTGDRDCGAAIIPGSADVVLDRLAAAQGERRVALVEDYGDIAVLRLGAAGEVGEQMLVLVRQKDGWLVRDVYDVADQPSDSG